MNRQSKTKRGILVAVMLVCLIALIGGTYARYSSTGTANAAVTLAKWHVKLNGTDISTSTHSENVTLTFDNNVNVADGKLAPGRTASFQIELDPAGSEVAIDYTFDVNSTGIASVLETGSTSKISVSGVKYKVGTGSEQTATKDSTTGLYTIAQNLTSVTGSEKVVATVTLVWDNDNDAQNVSDTAEGAASYTSTKTITIPVTVVAKQHI